MAGKFNLNALLSSTSKNAAQQIGQDGPTIQKTALKVIPISVHSLVPSKDNFYSVEQIEELKTSIDMFGIKQNLVVRPLEEEGKYKLIAGHRRRLAALKLFEEGKNEYEFVPCTIEPTDDEILEKLLLITTNATVRQLTDWERIEQAKQMRELLQEYKKNSKLPGRVRDLIAEALGTSPTQIGRMDAIDRNLTNEFKQELQTGGINISTAYELSGLSEESQQQAYQEYKDKGSLAVNDVKQKKPAAQRESAKSTVTVTKTMQQETVKPLEEPNQETIFDAMRKMNPEELADFLAKEMITAFEWDVKPIDILDWLNKPRKI